MGSSSSKAAATVGREGVTRRFPLRAPGTSLPHSAPRAKHESRPEDDVPKDQDRPLAAESNFPSWAQPLLSGHSMLTRSMTARRADIMDPGSVAAGFSQRLHRMGVVQPNSNRPAAASAAVFPSPEKNASLSVFEARQALQRRADDDLATRGRPGIHGRRFLDMGAVIDAMKMRDRGMTSSDIEARLHLEPGTMDRLGRPSVLNHILTNK